MLFAQNSASSSIPGWLVVVIVVVPAALVFVFTLSTILLRHLRATRTLLHTERLRSIEAGHQLEMSEKAKLQSRYMHNAFWISLVLTLGVPSTTLVAASAATRALKKSHGVVIAVWICTAAAIIASVVCSIVLMINSRHRREDVGESQKPFQQ
jgi:hypothetical protein